LIVEKKEFSAEQGGQRVVNEAEDPRIFWLKRPAMVFVARSFPGLSPGFSEEAE
jgi:hypothetical protein